MINVLFVFSLIFFHIVDDFYLQGKLADLKQKLWWEVNYPYENKYSYVVALIAHGFSWSFMIHIPVVGYLLASGKFYDEEMPVMFCFSLLFNAFAHAYTDNAKANKHDFGLILDQSIHILQLLWTALVYITYGWRII